MWQKRLPKPGVDDQRGHEGEMVRADPEHLRAMGGERPTRHRSGDDAGEVEDPYAPQWSIGGRQMVRGSRVELVHGDQGKRRDGEALWMGVPLPG